MLGWHFGQYSREDVSACSWGRFLEHNQGSNEANRFENHQLPTPAPATALAHAHAPTPPPPPPLPAEIISKLFPNLTTGIQNTAFCPKKGLQCGIPQNEF